MLFNSYMSRRAWAGVCLALLAVSFVAVVCLIDFNSPRLGQTLITEVKVKFGVRMAADGFRLNLWRGLRLDGVRFTTDGPSGRFTVQAAGLLAEHRLLALLRGRVEIERIVIEDPQIELVTWADQVDGARITQGEMDGHDQPLVRAPVVKNQVTGMTVLLGRVDRIWVRGGTLAARVEGAPAAVLQLQGLNIKLHDLVIREAPTALQALRGRGSLQASEVLIGGLHAVAGSGRLQLADGHFRLEDFKIKLPWGHCFLYKFDVDLNRQPLTYTLDSRVESLDANSVLDVRRGSLGPGTLKLTATGSGIVSGRDLVGKGTLDLAAGRLPRFLLFSQIENILGREILTGSAYKPVRVRFQVHGDRIDFDPFELRTSRLSLNAYGHVRLDGPVDLKIGLDAPSKVVAQAQLPRGFTRLANERGLVTVPLRVTETLASPKVIVDPSALHQAIEAIRKAAEPNIWPNVAESVWDYSLGFDLWRPVFRLGIITMAALALFGLITGWIAQNHRLEARLLSLVELPYIVLFSASGAMMLFVFVYPIFNLAAQFDAFPLVFKSELSSGVLSLRLVSVLLGARAYRDLRRVVYLYVFDWKLERVRKGRKKIELEPNDCAASFFQDTVLIFGIAILWFCLSQGVSRVEVTLMNWLLFFIVDDWFIIADYLTESEEVFLGHVLRMVACNVALAILISRVLAQDFPGPWAWLTLVAFWIVALAGSIHVGLSCAPKVQFRKARISRPFRG